MLCADLTREAAVQIGRMGAMAIGKAVAACSSLQKLELDENQVSEDGVSHLKVCQLLCPALPPIHSCTCLLLSHGASNRSELC